MALVQKKMVKVELDDINFNVVIAIIGNYIQKAFDNIVFSRDQFSIMNIEYLFDIVDILQSIASEEQVDINFIYINKIFQVIFENNLGIILA